MDRIRDQFYGIDQVVLESTLYTPTVAGGGEATGIVVDIDRVKSLGLHGLAVFVRAIGGDLYIDLMPGESSAVTQRAPILLADGEICEITFAASACTGALIVLAAAGGGVTAAVAVMGVRRQNKIGVTEDV